MLKRLGQKIRDAHIWIRTEINSTIKAFNESIFKVNSSMKDLGNKAQELSQKAIVGEGSMNLATTAMGLIRSSALKIKEITGLINDISDNQFIVIECGH
jgi:methyl-accepting chemotaxis protein